MRRKPRRPLPRRTGSKSCCSGFRNWNLDPRPGRARPGRMPVPHAPSLPDIGRWAPGLGVSGSKRPEDVSVTMQLLALLTVLSVAPAILMMMTAFTRIVIVLSLTRSALGTQQIPPNQVLMGLALCLTFFTMQPTLAEMNDRALQPYLAKRLPFDAAVQRALPPVRRFMLRQTRENDLALFVELSHTPRPRTARDVPA